MCEPLYIKKDEDDALFFPLNHKTPIYYLI